MTSQILFTMVTIIIMFILMVTEVIPLPATMALAGVALCFAGIVEPAKLYSEWGGSTIMFLILMSIIVDALTQTGIVQDLSDKIFTGKLIENQRVAIFAVCIFCGVATGFLSNTALVVMMIPVLAAMVVKSNGALQLKYMLLGAATEATVGGSVSLIGGAPNLAMQGALEEAGVETMGFFSAAPLSLILVVITALYFSTIGYTLMQKVCDFDDTEIVRQNSQTEKIICPLWKKALTLIVLVSCIVCFIMEVTNNQLVCFIGIIVLWVSGCAKPKESLKAVDWNTMWVLSFALVVAAAVNTSGTGAYIADLVLTACGAENASYTVVLIAVCLIGGVLTQVMSNTATNAMFGPICISIALSLGISPLALCVPVMVLVNCAVISPLGSPCMTVALAGGYRAKDYLYVGLPLMLILIPTGIIGALLIYGI